MFLSYLTLAVALCLSVIAAYYSIAGLAAIFAAAVIPIVIMGSILEIGKVVVTLWLHEYWSRCRWLMKLYLVPAVAVLMLITSMGIFGFLSKAHSDQSLVGGDVQAKIAIYDEKIKTAKDNIDANRKALKQMDEAVDQVMARSSSETGADKAVNIRRSQQKERARLQSEIQAEQKTITALSEERAPIAAEVRKVEAEVGPLKYIANLIYGDNPDANLLEKAVTWVIIIIVAVFDPLAIMMLLAATESMKWERQRVFERLGLAPKDEEDEFQAELDKKRKVARALDSGRDLPPDATVVVKQDPHPTGWMFTSNSEPTQEKSIFEQHPYLLEPFPHFKDLEPMVYKSEPSIYSGNPEEFQQQWPEEKREQLVSAMDSAFDEEKAAIRAWKKANPDDTIKRQRQMFSEGTIDQLPWDLGPQADNEPTSAQMRGFGTQWPENPAKGDTFLRVDRLPSALFKYNGRNWIEIDKKLSDQYSYDTAYIDHLIVKIDSGEYDPELLTDAEVEQIQQRIQTRNT
jgi:hypothetical protein